MKCPKCASERILQKNQAKKTGGLLGSIMAASGLVGALELAEIGLIFAPLGGAARVVSSAVMGGIAGEQIPLFLKHDLTITTSSIDKLHLIDQAAAAMAHIFLAVGPYVVMSLILLLAVFFIPGIATWLPGWIG